MSCSWINIVFIPSTRKSWVFNLLIQKICKEMQFSKQWKFKQRKWHYFFGTIFPPVFVYFRSPRSEVA